MPDPYVPAGTKTRFYRPPTLAADFTKFLDGDLPHMVMDFTILKSWYDQFKEGYEPSIIRGEFYADTAKSRYSNTDHQVNIRCDVNSGLRKGDMLIASDNGEVYIANWNVVLQTNNAPSRLLLCNLDMTVTRYVEELTDDMGHLIEKEGRKVIVDKLPANAYFYDGRTPSFYIASGNPGVSPEVVALVTAQYNEQTKNIRVDDEFIWGGDIYKITDVAYTNVDRTGTYGFLSIQASQKSGGIL